MLDSAFTGGPVLSVANSLSGRSWVWRTGCDRTGFAIAERLGVPEIVGRVLSARGVGLDDAADFLSPTLRALLPDPATMADMGVAADRLARAVATGETVAVFGDYDVDGACSAAILTLFLRGLGCPVLPYVPDRITEGYGPNAPALRHLAGQGATLVVCVDCGTAAHAALAALAGGPDVLVLDHHKAEGPTPPILATVNPNRLDCGSGLRHLCAAGVAFMAVVATLRVLRRAGAFAARAEPDLLGLLDLVALATICDVMPLTGLNRALVTQGLRVMGRRARPGLAALMDVAQRREGDPVAPTAMTCGFALGPRINAGGRISESDLGLRLLLCEDALDARLLAERLDAVNRQRQTVEAGVLADAAAEAERQMQDGHGVLLLCGARWHPGVVGIVAGRLRERFNRVACVGGVVDGMVKGSGRSVPGHDLGAAVIAARQSGLLASGGGHAMAAGFSLDPGRAGEFHAFLCDRLPVAPDAPRRPHLPVEAIVSAEGATVELAQHLGRLAPFGTANDEPVLAVAGVRVVKTDRLGNDGDTVRAFVQAEGGGRLKALLFRAGNGPLGQALDARDGMRLHLAGHLRAESWRGTVSASFCVVDAAPAG
jgi:single-stranded-DNA-specific exonuclease